MLIMKADAINTRFSYRNFDLPNLKVNVPSSKLSSFKTGGLIDNLLFLTSEHDVQQAFELASKGGLPITILGGCSNVLISDKGIRGLTMMPVDMGHKTIIAGNDVTVWAGVKLNKLVKFSEENGFSGLEWAIGIPGTVGGAVACNSGSFGGEVKDHLKSFVIIDKFGNKREIKGKELKFVYRKTEIPLSSIITFATFALIPEDIATIRNRIREFTRLRAETQPLDYPSAGSVFKNPPGDYAGRLIEEAGCKGLRMGDACVSSKHANFIINLGKATSTQIYDLIKLVREKVYKKYGIELELEIRLIGEFE